MTEETLTTEVEKPSCRWGRAEWGPVALLGSHVAFATLAFLALKGKTVDDDIATLRAIPIGAVLAQPLLCALWAAWAPSPLITRIPSALSALVLLGYCSFIKSGTPLDMLLIWGCLFAFYWLRLAAKRRAGKGYLSVLTDGSSALPATNQFSLKYLLFWTTVVAILLMIGRSINVWEGGVSTFFDPVWKSVGITVMSSGVYSLLLLPVFVVGVFVLESSKQSLVEAAKKSFWILLLYASTATIILMSWGSSLFSDFFMAIGNFYLGAMLTMALSALVLRWSGYRLVRNMIYPLSTQAHPVEADDARDENR